jgi:integrase/recombinase XerD
VRSALDGLKSVHCSIAPQTPFWEFFTAEIPNDNTRKAYFCAIRRFDVWCVLRNLNLHRLQPILIAAYMKELQASLSVPSVKQHLAAIRMLFDYRVLRGFCG